MPRKSCEYGGGGGGDGGSGYDSAHGGGGGGGYGDSHGGGGGGGGGYGGGGEHGGGGGDHGGGGYGGGGDHGGGDHGGGGGYGGSGHGDGPSGGYDSHRRKDDELNMTTGYTAPRSSSSEEVTLTGAAAASYQPSSQEADKYSLAKLLQNYGAQESSNTHSLASKYAPSDHPLLHNLMRKTEAAVPTASSLSESLLDIMEELDVVEHVPGFFGDDESIYTSRK